MKWQIKIIIASLISFILGLSISIYAQDNHDDNNSKPIIEYNNENLQIPEIEIEIETNNSDGKRLTKTEIESLAKSITVKILAGKNSGSGILIKQENNLYTVVTNDHVLIFGQEKNDYKIITPDDEIYIAKKVNNIDFYKNDLGLLTFESDKEYLTIELKKSAKAILGEEVYASGFPFNDDINEPLSIDQQFVFTQGRIDMMSELSFRGGYQIGYTNSIKKGMSGGPIFNEKGEIIGINGRHKYPLWGNPYVFEDGSIASPDKKEEMSHLSWGIPIQTFLQFSSQFAHKLTE